MTGGWRPPTPPQPVEFPEYLPVWDLVEDGVIIADFYIGSIKGIAYVVKNGVLHLARPYRKWNYDNKVVEAFETETGINYNTIFQNVCGSNLPYEAAIPQTIVDESSFNYRAEPAG